ncbi:hypothetical protein GVN24_02330 [Rhizobium sp. CRIBSB]|nr:hypothetical protein [Rhizobium sp. CRIBSB]
MTDLAGPNDTLQILLEWSWWQQLVAAGLATYATAIVAEAGKDTWVGLKALVSRSRAPSIEGKRGDIVNELSGIASEAQAAGNHVILGLPLDQRFQRRNMGIELANPSPEEVFKAATVLSLIGESLSQTIDELVATNQSVSAIEENGDCSGKISLHADGSSSVKFRIHPVDHRSFYDLHLSYDSNGALASKHQTPTKSPY